MKEDAEMIFSQTFRKTVIMLTSAFFLCGLLRVLLYGVDFTNCFSEVFTCALLSVWMISVRKRVTDGRLRRILIWIVVFLLLHFILQILRYDLFRKDDITALRYLWYAMYIPLTAQPVLLCFLAVCIHRPEEKKMPAFCFLILGVAILLMIGVLTNDLHFWAKSFPGGVMIDNGEEKNGWLFYAINVFEYGLYFFDYGLILRKNHSHTSRRYRYVVLIPLLVGVLYFGLYSLNIGNRLFHTRIWQMAQMTAFLVVAVIEGCIQVGLIPANRAYETIFNAAGFSAAILDSTHKPVYKTEGAEYPFQNSESTKLVSHPIRGGSIEYLVNMEQLLRLNRELEEQARLIKARNAYIAEETRIKQEKTELEYRNGLYERISGLVNKQLDRINTILDAGENCGEKDLACIAVLETYIKRRSNMELLAASGTLAGVELVSAVSESLEYLRLCGVNTAVSSSGTEVYSAGTVIDAYKSFEDIIEENLDTITDMSVSIQETEGRITIRFLVQADSFSCESLAGRQSQKEFLFAKENDDIIIALSFMEGGEGE